MKHRKYYFPRCCHKAMRIEMSTGNTNDNKTLVKTILTCEECENVLKG